MICERDTIVTLCNSGLKPYAGVLFGGKPYAGVPGPLQRAVRALRLLLRRRPQLLHHPRRPRLPRPDPHRGAGPQTVLQQRDLL